VKRTSRLLVLSPLILAPSLFAACSGGSSTNTTSSTSASSTTSSSGAGGSKPDGGAPEGGPEAGTGGSSPACTALGLTSRPFVTTGTGPNRGDLAADFTLSLVDGTRWTFSAEAVGCESYVFVPDILTVSQTDTSSIWGGSDLPALVKGSPQNVHYFFVSLSSASVAKTNTTAMQAKITKLLAPGGGLSASAAAHWKTHLHVVADTAVAIKSWVGDALLGWAQQGFCIDRRQRLRGLGFLSDVTRQDPNAPANGWPFESNLAYAANEPIYMNAQSDELDRLDAEDATVVPVFTGGVIAEEGYATVQLPSPAEMAKFDTLEVEVTMACPDPTAIEFNSCGAWDYIASLYLDTTDADAGVPADAGPDAGPPITETELARFITAYHRETHWVEDISPMIGLLPGSGTTRLHYSFAPSWNTQPTAVTLSLRFSNQKKGYVPDTLTYIASGGTWDPTYDMGRMPVSVPIPSDTKHAEIWMIVTGHGSSTDNQCGEFCDSQHVFTVNGAANTWTVDFPMAGTETGCIVEEKSGMVPNQGGTWWYGRDGWCPGWQVDPHVWDVTALVQPGSTATVTYEGLFNGAPPPADMNAGNIVLTSYLVTFH
jgi:Peptide-N-glycosidase F, C terminal